MYKEADTVYTTADNNVIVFTVTKGKMTSIIEVNKAEQSAILMEPCDVAEEYWSTLIRVR